MKWPLLERLVVVAERWIAVQERGSGAHNPTLSYVDPRCLAKFKIKDATQPEPEAHAFALDADEPIPPTMNPIAQALDDVCGEGAHSDQRLRRHLNSVTIPKLKTEKLSDEEIAQRIMDGAE